MRTRRRRLRSLRLLAILLWLTLLGWTFRDLEPACVTSGIARAGGGALLLVLVPMGCALAIESYGWTWAFRRFGHDVLFTGVWRARVTSEALALPLPAGMLFCESTKPFLLARHCGLGTGASLAGMA